MPSGIPLQGSGSDKSPVVYSGEKKSDAFLRFVQEKAGVWIGLPGQVKELDAIAKKFGTAADKTGLVAEAKALGMSDEARRPRDAEGEGGGRVGRRRAGCHHWGRRPSPPGAHSFARTRHRPTSPHDKRCL